jgi:hypothetical protein
MIKICPFTQEEFSLGMGIIIAVARYNFRRYELWARENQDVPVMADPKTWQSILKDSDFGKFMGKISLKKS